VLAEEKTMTLRRTITHFAFDSVHNYCQERLEQLKQLDLDHDGRKDVDQMAEMLTRVFDKLKVAIEATDFHALGTGLEQVIAGAGAVGTSIDMDKMGAACSEMVIGLKQAGKLLQLGIAEIKRQEKQL
jgi:hypothetical protein